MSWTVLQSTSTPISTNTILYHSITNAKIIVKRFDKTKFTQAEAFVNKSIEVYQQSIRYNVLTRILAIEHHGNEIVMVEETGTNPLELFEVLRTDEKYTEKVRCLFIKVLKSIEGLHSSHIIHREITPNRIKLVKEISQENYSINYLMKIIHDYELNNHNQIQGNDVFESDKIDNISEYEMQNFENFAVKFSDYENAIATKKIAFDINYNFDDEHNHHLNEVQYLAFVAPELIFYSTIYSKLNESKKARIKKKLMKYEITHETSLFTPFQSDIWSLGLFLFTLVVHGSITYFNSQNDEISCFNGALHIFQSPLWIENNSSLSPWLRDFLKQALAISPVSRNTVHELMTHQWMTLKSVSTPFDRRKQKPLRKPFSFENIATRQISRFESSILVEEQIMKQQQILNIESKLPEDKTAILDSFHNVLQTGISVVHSKMFSRKEFIMRSDRFSMNLFFFTTEKKKPEMRFELPDLVDVSTPFFQYDTPQVVQQKIKSFLPTPGGSNQTKDKHRDSDNEDANLKLRPILILQFHSTRLEIRIIANKKVFSKLLNGFELVAEINAIIKNEHNESQSRASASSNETQIRERAVTSASETRKRELTNQSQTRERAATSETREVTPKITGEKRREALQQWVTSKQDEEKPKGFKPLHWIRNNHSFPVHMNLRTPIQKLSWPNARNRQNGDDLSESEQKKSNCSAFDEAEFMEAKEK